MRLISLGSPTIVLNIIRDLCLGEKKKKRYAINNRRPHGHPNKGKLPHRQRSLPQPVSHSFILPVFQQKTPSKSETPPGITTSSTPTLKGKENQKLSSGHTRRSSSFFPILFEKKTTNPAVPASSAFLLTNTLDGGVKWEKGQG